MSEKVLVVDDEKSIRDLLNKFLEREGYEVILASNGEEAIELAERENPHLILLDIMMPGLDGIETCRRLKANKITQSIPVIMASAVTETMAQALEVGVDDFVIKPVQLPEVSIRIKSILRVRHLTDELERAVAYTMELKKNLSSHGEEWV
jgi:DNA-binding response OmpR family regulator